VHDRGTLTGLDDAKAQHRIWLNAIDAPELGQPYGWAAKEALSEKVFGKDVVVGSSRGGAVAVNLDSGSAQLVLICPAWKKWGMAERVKPGTQILHSRADDVVPFADSIELLSKSGLPESALIEVGRDHRLADPEPLEALLRAVDSRRESP
jgi:hypothetical protein